MKVVCLGAVKKVAAGSFAAFEFRLRVVADANGVKAGQRLAWSVVFPLKPGQEIPAEGFLHLPQKQKFNAVIFLDKKTITIERANMMSDESGGGRLSLTDQSVVTIGQSFTEWNQLLKWSPEIAVERIHKHTPGPLDLETELQEEIVLHEYEVGDAGEGDLPGQFMYPIIAGKLALAAMVSSGVEGKALCKNLDDLRKRKKDRPPLFGLLHYERCRLVFQPLTAFRPDPDYLTISQENVNKAALLKTMSFR